MMACAGRHHTWKENPPRPGTTCTKCGAIFGAPRTRATLGAPSTLGADRSSRLLAALASLAPPPTAPVAVAVVEQGGASFSESASESDDTYTPPARPNGWQKGVARRARRIFFGLLDSAIESVGRKPAEPDQDDETDVEESLAASLAAAFPDGTLSPTKGLILACSFAAGSAWASSKKIPASDKPPEVAAPAVAAQAPRAPAPALPSGAHKVTAFDG